MASNKFSSLSQAALATVGKKFSTAATAGPAAYGLTAAQATALATSLTAFEDAVAACDEAAAAYEACVQAKATARLGLIGELSAKSKIAYAYPSITNALLSGAGLAIHQEPAPITPATPSDLVANPLATGDVQLKWNRNGNPSGVSFIVEGRGETGEWEILTVVTATRVTLNNYTPGVPAWFRVSASTRGIISTPSLEVAIYHDGVENELQVAA